MTATADDGFRLMTVAASHRIAPRMQRLRLTGDNLARFDTFANLHVRLYVAESSCTALPCPVLGPDGRPRLSGRTDGCAMRYYTIRDIDAEAGWLDIDFVLHEDAGPACDFARRARPGDICGISGPCGLSVKPARNYLLAGDETALPAIARIARSLPDDAEGLILIDTHAPDGWMGFPIPTGMTLRWISRCCGHEAEAYVPSVSRAIAEIAGANDDHFIWIAGEFSDCAALRPCLGRIHKSRHINVPYWRASSCLEARK
jgi:NADPH-dependent ferric siderophore reductase